MPTPPTDNLRVVKYATGWGHAASEWSRALRGVDWSKPHAEGGPERLKLRAPEGGSANSPKDCTVWRARLELGSGSGKRSADVVIKLDPLDSVRKRVQSVLRRTKAFRQWRGDALLHSAGIRSADCRAVIVGSTAQATCEMLILEAVGGKTLLEHLAATDLPVRDEHAIARAVGQHLATQVRKGVVNRDGKPSNLIVDVSGTRPEIIVVDTVAISRETNLLGQPEQSDDHIDLMLCDLVLEAIGCDCPPRRTLMLRCLLELVRAVSTPADVREDCRALWTHTADLVRAHGDPTPKDDPLARG